MNDERLFKKHLQSGQNINMYSLEANHTFVNEFVEKGYIDRDGVEGLVFATDWTRPLREFVAENYERILTKKQITYVESSDTDKKELYPTSNRSQYRKQMRKRLLGNLIGEDIKYYHRLDTHLRNLLFINKFIAEDFDNCMLCHLIKEEIDTDYVSELVYERMSDTSCSSVVKAIQDNVCLESFALYEMSQLLIEDYKLIHSLILENKRC